jgi:hypothetical protein
MARVWEQVRGHGAPVALEQAGDGMRAIAGDRIRATEVERLDGRERRSDIGTELSTHLDSSLSARRTIDLPDHAEPTPVVFRQAPHRGRGGPRTP